MGQVITLAGERLFALKAQNNQQLDIDTFIFAYVPGQDSTAPIDRNEGLPPVNQRVHTQIVQQYGMINDNAVVYSSVLDSLTGPFQFNWVGLYSSVNQTLVAIQHIPTVSKTVTEPGASGNILNRNFVIEYSGIAESTGITVDPATWQLDYTARLNGMDELTRQLAADMNGKDWFIDDGFKVVPRSTLNTFKVTAGAGYVSGLRVELAADHILTLSSYPQFVYVDAWFDGTSESVWKGHTAFTVTNTEMDDYIDVNGRNHYVFKLARITAADVVEDLRNVEGLGQKIDAHLNNQNSAHHASAISTSSGSNVDAELSILKRNNNRSAATIAGELVAGTAAGGKFYFFGDSTMWGSEPAPNTTTQQDANPPAMFKIGLDILFPSNSITVTNKAIKGSNLYSMLRGINHYYPNAYKDVLEASNPSVVFCNHCLNDCSSDDGETNINQYFLDLLEFVDITRSFGAIPVLVTPMIHAPIGSGTIQQTHRQQLFIQAMRDVAAKKTVDLVDCNALTMASLTEWKPMDIAPDGAHLSPMFSAQYGYNMLIPLVKPVKVDKVGDIAGLSNNIWQEYLPDVFNKLTNTSDSRFGPTLLGQSNGSELKINFPILLSSATKDTFLAFGGSAWDGHAVAQITYFNGYGTIGVLEGSIDGGIENATSDAIFSPVRCRLPAGLSIVGVKIPASTPIDKVFTFSGVTLVPRNFFGHGPDAQSRSIMSGDIITTKSILIQDVPLIQLVDEDDENSVMLDVTWNNGTGNLVITTPYGTDILLSGLLDANEGQQYEFSVIVEARALIVKIGGVSKTLSGFPYALPKLKVANYIAYSVYKP